MTKDEPASAGREQRVKDFVVEALNPLDIADEIKGLFLEEGSTEFGPFFEFAYPRMVEMGGCSVVARGEGGKLIMHVGVFPRTFRLGDDRLSAGLLGDLLVAEPYRNFWSAVHFIHRIVEILTEGRRYDFLFTDPQEVSFAIVRAGGFDIVGSMRRYMLPLVLGWLSVLRLRTPVMDLSARQLTWEAGLEHLAHQVTLTSGGAFRPHRSNLFYESRAWTQVTERSEWIVLYTPDGDPAEAPVGLVLTTPLPPRHTLTFMDIFWDDRQVDLESVLYGAASQARALGYRKIGMRALDGSLLGVTARRCGFIVRKDDQPLLARTLREDLKLPPAEEWLLTWIDGSSW